MTKSAVWLEKFEKEINSAKEARSAGNEGMARVCARRAAGIIVSEYLKKSSNTIPGNSIYNLLNELMDMAYIKPEIEVICRHFLLHVNERHELPSDIDLIADAYILKQLLLE